MSYRITDVITMEGTYLSGRGYVHPEAALLYTPWGVEMVLL